MELKQSDLAELDQIVELYRDTFTASEGPDEGGMIADLSKNLMTTTQTSDIYIFTAVDQGVIVGAIIFTRLRYDGSDQSVFVLGPVAVHSQEQSKGVGSALIRHGLDVLQRDGVGLATTYGDPNYYTRFGFIPTSQDDVSAPFSLQYPEGWMVQSLQGQDIPNLTSNCSCVSAFDNPTFW